MDPANDSVDPASLVRLATQDDDSDDRGFSRINGAHDQIRDRILTGELAPGTVVSQAALARELGVSRAPIREALRRLEGEGLVESRHNQRVLIADLSISDMEDIYASRIVIESLVARFAVPLLDDDDVAEMWAAWRAMRECAQSQDRQAWEAQHSRFHLVTLNKGGGRLAAQIAQLSDHAKRYRNLYLTQVSASWDVILTQDAAIIDAVEHRRDADTVVDRWARHIASTALSTIAVVDPTYDARLVRAALQGTMSATPTARPGARQHDSRSEQTGA